MTPDELCADAIRAIQNGTDMVMHIPSGHSLPRGWPRGELLCMNKLGRNLAFDPVKVLAYMQRCVKEAKQEARS